MAERRMFAKSVIGSARFLRMPPSSRLLYFDLGMAADDDGVVEAFSVMRMTGATEDDLRVLASKRFVTVLNEDLVTYITDWTTNNQLRKDRYHPSVYAELLVRLGDGNNLATDWQPSGNQMETESSLVKSKGVRVLVRQSRPPAPALFLPLWRKLRSTAASGAAGLIQPSSLISMLQRGGWWAGTR